MTGIQMCALPMSYNVHVQLVGLSDGHVWLGGGGQNGILFWENQSEVRPVELQPVMLCHRHECILHNRGHICISGFAITRVCLK